MVARGPNGKYFALNECPICGGEIVYGGPVPFDPGKNFYHCTGLVDPLDNSKPLEPCDFEYQDGDPRP
jgi:hypothetical protein